MKEIPTDGYRITSQSKIHIAKELSQTALAYAILIIAAYYFSIFQDYGAGLFVSAIYLFDVFMCINLYPQYRDTNINMVLYVDIEKKLMTIVDNGNSILFSFEDIKNITLYLSSSYYRGGPGVKTWDIYHYAVIDIVGGKRFIITSLLIDDLREFFDERNLSYNKVLQYYTSIKPEHYQNSN